MRLEALEANGTRTILEAPRPNFLTSTPSISQECLGDRDAHSPASYFLERIRNASIAARNEYLEAFEQSGCADN